MNIIRSLTVLSFSFVFSICAVTKSDLQNKATQFLLSRQESSGGWVTSLHQPAITALVITGLRSTPDYINNTEIKAACEKALDFIAAHAQADGGIYATRQTVQLQRNKHEMPAEKPHKGNGKKGKLHKGGAPLGGYPVYNTSICLMAFAAFNRPQDTDIISNARSYVIAANDNSEHQSGGYGYGNKTRADLNNTAWALEALYATEYLDKEPYARSPQRAATAALAWQNAISFISSCQNLADTNQAAWVASAPTQDNGGFIYCPEDALKTDRTPEALRSYGTMTYAALKSMIYAKLPKDDVRIQSAIQWLANHYTLDENPGVGQSGLFYYFHTFSKTLALLGPTFRDSHGTLHNWPQELIDKLASLQRPDGSWLNSQSGRWMENLPELATAYALMALAEIKTQEQ